MKRILDTASRKLDELSGLPALRLALSRVMTGSRAVVRHGLSAAGLAGIAAVGVFYFYPQLGEQLIALSPFSETASEEVAQVESASGSVGTAESSVALAAPQLASPQLASPQLASPPLAATAGSATAAAVAAGTTKAGVANPASVHAAHAPELMKLGEAHPAHGRQLPAPEQYRVTSWIAKRYRVATDAAQMLVGATYATAREMHLDPLLILAVIAIESRFNPFAESPQGAKGLMQVMAHVHKDKFQPLGGVQAALNPVANIKVGSSILKDYVRRTGSLEGALKLYVGAADLETDSGYGSKVISEYNKLKEVARGGKPAAPAKAPRLQEVKTETIISASAEPA